MVKNGVRPGRCTEGGQCIGWIDNGDWAEYDVQVRAPGEYTVDFRVASHNAGGGTIHLMLAGKRIASVDVPNTASWQNWRTVSVNAVFVEAGSQVLRLEFSGGMGTLLNVSWFEVPPRK